MRRLWRRLRVVAAGVPRRFAYLAGGCTAGAFAVGVVIVLTAGGAPGAARLSAIAPPERTATGPTVTVPPSAGPTAPSPTTTGAAGGSGGGSGGGTRVGGNPPPGTGQFAYAASAGPVLGAAGTVNYFQVAVETGLAMPVDGFADWVDNTLGDPRSWVHDGRRFERVAGGSGGSFTVFLASPWTAYQLCLPTVDILIGGVPYTSCQNGSRVVINSARFLGDPGAFTGSMTDYRRYVINHEVGHRLGYQHVACPGAGLPAPVMQQQTLFMSGCLPNAWPHPEIPAPTTPPPSPSPSPTPSPTPTPTPTDSPTPSATASDSPTPAATSTEPT